MRLSLGVYREASCLTFLLLVLRDVNPVSLQLDLDKRMQLHDIMMDFKVCSWGPRGMGEGFGLRGEQCFVSLSWDDSTIRQRSLSE